MTILFPGNPLQPRQVEPDFAAQAHTARELGLDILLLDSDALAQGEISRALRFIRPADPQVLVYRGWMLRSEIYHALFDALLERGWRLLNDPQSYALCHELPNWYALLEGRTPRSAWLAAPECFQPERVLECAARLGSEALVVKDYVKSRKHEWSESCFIAEASDAAQVERVTSTFLARQGESLVGGLVLRQFVPLREVAPAGPSGAPGVNEWRLFWLDHALIARSPSSVWVGEGPTAQVLAELQDLAARIPSRFFAMDVAQQEDGGWIVIELGDGGVSGLPPHLDAARFYSALQQVLTEA